MSSKRKNETNANERVKKTTKKSSASSPAKKEAMERDELPEYIVPNEFNSISIVTWNVNGLKALVSSKLSTLTDMIKKHQPDILCLQETKIQESMIDQYSDLLPGYDSYYSCSTVKKGYSGTAIFLRKDTLDISKLPTKSVKKKQAKLSFDSTKKEENEESKNNSSESKKLIVEKISFDFEDEEKKFEGEGRTLTIETDKFILLACYVPNSGDGLKRLNFRVSEWDPYVREYLNKLNKRKPVVFTGDLNVGHLDIDIHNPEAKHISKQAGLTPQERESFSKLLENNFHDAFRFLYPEAKGQFTYWSQRTFARPVNKGLRLDYFICSQDMFPVMSENSSKSVDNLELRKNIESSPIPTPGVLDCRDLNSETVGCSDHCPVKLVLRI